MKKESGDGKINRRQMLKSGLGGAFLLAGATQIGQTTGHAAEPSSALPPGSSSATTPDGMPTRPRGMNQTYMGGFAAPKLSKVRMAMIGVGARGGGHCRSFAGLQGVDVVAISDLYEDLAKKNADKIKKNGHTPKLYFGEKDAWQKMLQEVRPDVVVISTPWQDHAPMAIAAMQAGAHALVEVPLALTTDEMWQIVDTSEATKKHCMMMENVNYGRTELLFLNMIRQGLLGELLHGEAAYIHELRKQMNQVKRGTGSWRTQHYADRNGNLYPTHGLGPVAQYMNLARGEDQFRRLVSFSSPAKGRKLFAEKKFPADHKWNQLDFKGGDMSTAIIKTMLGRTIMVQWDETSPRPYDRLNLIQGTKGTMAGYPEQIAIEGVGKGHHQWAQGKEFNEIAKKHEHPLWSKMGELAKKQGGHGGMDFLMRYRIIDCLLNGQPLDQNVYEGVLWSAVGPLTEASVAQDGMPQDFPDFTRGDWRKTAPLGIIS
ncbi:alpha-N-acetylgalactosaminidase [bacterium M21]|nr:alpha-N-acetylgalactosaminidase [bacterium M21]